jgi:hypothetical protein
MLVACCRAAALATTKSNALRCPRCTDVVESRTQQVLPLRARRTDQYDTSYRCCQRFVRRASISSRTSVLKTSEIASPSRAVIHFSIWHRTLSYEILSRVGLCGVPRILSSGVVDHRWYTNRVTARLEVVE